MPPAIEINQLDFTYASQPILRQIDLTVERGTTLGLVGPNGGGKTTLIRLLLGLLRPGAGSIRIGGLPPPEAGRHFVPETKGERLAPTPAQMHDAALTQAGKIHQAGRHVANDDTHRLNPLQQGVQLACHGASSCFRRVADGVRVKVQKFQVGSLMPKGTLKSA